VQFSTTEGWIDVMNRAIDAVGIDMQPKVNYNLYISVLFIVIIILGNFLMLNVFTGVVVQTFK
jgi:Ion transport protein